MEKPRERDACISLFQSRAVQTAKGIYYIDAYLFYLGRAKFPDRMASRTAPVPKPIYKHAGVTLAIQARRFVDRHELSRILPRSIHMFQGRKRSEKRSADILRNFFV